jgi:hypothetical protein
MLVTGRSLIMPGMVAEAAGPVYRVMMIVPLLVTQLYWAGD